MNDSGFAGVRIGNKSDAKPVFDLLLKMHDENGLAPPNHSKSWVFVDGLCSNRALGLVGIIEGEHGIEATVGLKFTAWWYTDEHHLEDVWNFVHPDCRRTTHAKRLIEFEKWCADKIGVKLINGILTTTRLAPKLRLYQRQMSQVGALFIHGPLPQPDFVSQRTLPDTDAASDEDAGYVRT